MPITFTESGLDTFTLSGASTSHVNLSNVLVLAQPQSVFLFTTAQGAGVSFWAVDPANAQLLSSGQAFQGQLLSPGHFGLTTVALPAGTWLFGATETVAGAPVTGALVDASTLSVPGSAFTGNVPMAVFGEPGAWRALGFTVQNHPQGFIETEATGGHFMVMTDAQFHTFQSEYPSGYTGGSYAALSAIGEPGTNLQGELTLAPGAYDVVWVNDTGGWAGGAANLTFFADNSTGAAASLGSAAPNGGVSIVQTDLPSAGDDVLVASPANAEIHAGAGNDTITGSISDDYLRGDDGNDSVQGGPGFDDINGNKGNDTIDGGSGGGDWLVGGQGDDLITSHHSDDILYGNLGNDTLRGGDGVEVIRGGQGDDSIVGGSGNDFISGDRGNDTETGGAGADMFHFSQDAGIDKVLDFHYAEGDRVMLDPGTIYTVSQVGADTIIDTGAGNEMILVGVQLSTLPKDWIFGA